MAARCPDSLFSVARPYALKTGALAAQAWGLRRSCVFPTNLQNCLNLNMIVGENPALSQGHTDSCGFACPRRACWGRNHEQAFLLPIDLSKLAVATVPLASLRVQNRRHCKQFLKPFAGGSPHQPCHGHLLPGSLHRAHGGHRLPSLLVDTRSEGAQEPGQGSGAGERGQGSGGGALSELSELSGVPNADRPGRLI